jgi:hypothetical protein
MICRMILLPSILLQCTLIQFFSVGVHSFQPAYAGRQGIRSTGRSHSELFVSRSFSTMNRNSTFDVSSKQPTRGLIKKKQSNYKVYCDLDGVLVDFEHGIRQLFPEMKAQPCAIQDLHRATMWERVAATGDFFQTLPWTLDGRRLWQQLQCLRPTILTGVPAYKRSRLEKFQWCQQNLVANGDGATHMTHIDRAGDWNEENHGHVIVNGASCTPSEHSLNVITCWYVHVYMCVSTRLIESFLLESLSRTPLLVLL